MCSMATYSVGEYFHTKSTLQLDVFLLGPKHLFDNLGHFYLREFRSLFMSENSPRLKMADSITLL